MLECEDGRRVITSESTWTWNLRLSRKKENFMRTQRSFERFLLRRYISHQLQTCVLAHANWSKNNESRFLLRCQRFSFSPILHSFIDFIWHGQWIFWREIISFSRVVYFKSSTNYTWAKFVSKIKSDDNKEQRNISTILKQKLALDGALKASCWVFSSLRGCSTNISVWPRKVFPSKPKFCHAFNR